MKKMMLILALASAQALAQGGKTTSKMDTYTPKAATTAKGIRAAIIVPDWAVQMKIEHDGTTYKSDKFDKFDNVVGVSGGYAYIPINNFGFIANLAYFNIHETNSDLGYARIEGDATLGANENLYFKLGLNLSKIVTSEDANNFKPALGWQLGLGAQFTKNLGMEVSVVQMTTTRHYKEQEEDGFIMPDHRREFIFTGPEFALTGTF